MLLETTSLPSTLAVFSAAVLWLMLASAGQEPSDPPHPALAVSQLGIPCPYHFEWILTILLSGCNLSVDWEVSTDRISGLLDSSALAGCVISGKWETSFSLLRFLPWKKAISRRNQAALLLLASLDIEPESQNKEFCLLRSSSHWLNNEEQPPTGHWGWTGWEGFGVYQPAVGEHQEWGWSMASLHLEYL